MAWRFRKTKNFGPFRFTNTRDGMGSSIGFLGFRIGVNSSGRRFWSFCIRGTGLCYIKYF